METVSIRNLRGADLREKALEGKPLAVTNRGALIGVIIPVSSAWLEHLIDYNLSHVHQSIEEAEHAIVADAPMVTLHDVVGQLQAVLNPPRSGPGEETAAKPSALTVRMGDLTATLIEEAGAAGQTVAITHDRELIAILIPVTRDLVEFLLEQNMSRVLYNITEAEKGNGTAGPMTTLDQFAGSHKARSKPESGR